MPFDPDVAPAVPEASRTQAHETEPPERDGARRVVFYDGRVELLDADFVVGRNPLRTPVKEHQRAVVVGEGDRTVSRRHVELQVGDRQVMAVCLGQHATVVDAAGAPRHLIGGETCVLAPGDTLQFGTGAWLRYETGPDPEGDNGGDDGSHQGTDSDDESELSSETDTKVRDSTTRNLDLAAIDGSGSPPAEPVEAAEPDKPEAVGSVLFSDGSVEPLDAVLIIGRSPTGEPLEPHQRAVVHGTGDRTVSRRHIELRVEEDKLQATNLGRYTAYRTEAGDERELVTGELVHLEPGDELHFGTESWLRHTPKVELSNPRGRPEHGESVGRKR